MSDGRLVLRQRKNIHENYLIVFISGYFRLTCETNFSLQCKMQAAKVNSILVIVANVQTYYIRHSYRC